MLFISADHGVARNSLVERDEASAMARRERKNDKLGSEP